jgi:hypothetical protein
VELLFLDASSGGRFGDFASQRLKAIVKAAKEIEDATAQIGGIASTRQAAAEA